MQKKLQDVKVGLLLKIVIIVQIVGIMMKMVTLSLIIKINNYETVFFKRVFKKS